MDGFTLKKARSRQNLAETIIDADYANDIVLLAAQAESLKHSLEQAARIIVLNITSDKTEFMN